jgi:ATP-dependent 26S proteasome regulatory subunit
MMTTKLCPAQQTALDGLLAAAAIGNILVLRGVGMGKTTVLHEVHRSLGGAFLTVKGFVDAMRPRHPLAIEETFEQWVRDALAAHDTVLLDDLNLISDVTGGCGSYPRPGFLNAAMTGLAAYVVEARKKLILACGYYPTAPIHHRSYTFGIDDFKPADYEFLCHASLGPERSGRLDYAKIHRYAPHLNAHQLTGAAVWLRNESGLDTERFIDFLRSQHLTSNVDLHEVRAVTLADLKGVDEVIRSLETHIILPLEDDELATTFGLKPKRGVLLAGPPGTGKTTVGRALAHRLKSKFFLVDGTCISGTSHFYGAIHGIFEAAKDNAPSIIFVDDSDAIFESGGELGLYRYLLTMLDGLESETVGRVCVMMTAMDVSHLPPALIRSGRIELWLEMHLPDEEARAAILRQSLASLPAALGAVELARLVPATDDFTGADLKRLIEDGKNLLAYDKARGVPLRPPTDYFLDAIDTVCANKERYAEAEARARQQRPRRPVYFDS